MAIYAHVTLEISGAGMAKFCAVMAEAVPILEAQGWRLASALIQRTGRLNTVIDIWALEDMNHFDRGLKVFVAHERFAAIKAVLDEVTLSETIVFAQDAPYARGA